MTLTLLRHPRPRVAPGLCYGRLDLAPGEGAPREIAAVLAALPPVSAVLTSPTRRCLALATAVAAREGLPLCRDARLQELDFGRWEGRRWDEIDRRESDPWAEDPLNRAPPGGERFADLLAWVGAVLGAAPPGAALICHAGPIRAARMLADGIGFDAAFAAPVPYAEPIRIAWPPRAAAAG
ncbi:MAG: histidine phosphatase family protein [Pseudomonadota bacterium]